MKLKFNIRVKDLVQSRQLQKDVYFEAGKTYDIVDKGRVRLIVNRGWAEVEKTQKEVKVETTEGAGDSSPAPKGRKAKVE